MGLITWIKQTGDWFTESDIQQIKDANNDNHNKIVALDGSVLKKDNTDPYTPTDDFHPATKKFVEDSSVAVYTDKGEIDCSTNPNYPPGALGDSYYVSVAGKIGGAEGKNVDVGDTIRCKSDNPGGDEATVGINWYIVQGNIEKATQTEAETGSDDQKFMTPLKVAQKWVYDVVNKTISQLNTTSKNLVGAINELHNKVTIANQTEAEDGTEDTKLMTPLKVAQKWIYDAANRTISSLQTNSKNIVGAINELKDKIVIANQTEAEAGTDDTKLMTPLKVAQKWIYDVANRTISSLQTNSKNIVGAINELKDKIVIANQAEAEDGTNDAKIMTPLKVAHKWLYDVLNRGILDLQTADKTLLGAINEINGNIGISKQSLAEVQTVAPTDQNRYLNALLGLEQFTYLLANLDLTDITSGPQKVIKSLNNIHSEAFRKNKSNLITTETNFQKSGSGWFFNDAYQYSYILDTANDRYGFIGVNKTEGIRLEFTKISDQTVKSGFLIAPDGTITVYDGYNNAGLFLDEEWDGTANRKWVPCWGVVKDKIDELRSVQGAQAQGSALNFTDHAILTTTLTGNVDITTIIGLENANAGIWVVTHAGFNATFNSSLVNANQVGAIQNHNGYYVIKILRADDTYFISDYFGSSNSMGFVQEASKVWLNTEIATGNTTPYELKAAPGADKLIRPFKAYAFLKFNSTPYATHTVIELLVGATVVATCDILGVSTDTRKEFTFVDGVSPKSNQPMTVRVQGGDPPNGDSHLKIKAEHVVSDESDLSFPSYGPSTFIDVSPRRNSSSAAPTPQAPATAINDFRLQDTTILNDLLDTNGNPTAIGVEFTGTESGSSDGDETLTGLTFTGATIDTEVHCTAPGTFTFRYFGFAANQSGLSLEIMSNHTFGNSSNRKLTLTINGVAQPEVDSLNRAQTDVFSDLQANASGELVILMEATGTAGSNNFGVMNAMRVGF